MHGSYEGVIYKLLEERPSSMWLMGSDISHNHMTVITWRIVYISEQYHCL